MSSGGHNTGYNKGKTSAKAQRPAREREGRKKADSRRSREGCKGLAFTEMGGICAETPAAAWPVTCRLGLLS